MARDQGSTHPINNEGRMLKLFMKVALGIGAPVLAVIIASEVRAAAPPARAPTTAARTQTPTPAALTVVQVKPNIYMIAGAGGNVVIHDGPDGAIVVDTGRAESGAALLAEIRRLTSQPIRYVINTSADPEHTGGNATLSLAGEPLASSPAGFGEMQSNRPVAPILAEEQVLARMSTLEQSAYAHEAWPTSTYSAAAGEPHRKLVMNGDAIDVIHQPSAHTDGDSLVYFRRSDVLVTGDILDLTRFPVIDRARGGSIAGILDGLNRIIDMSFSSTPFFWHDDGTLIVPGHGRLAGTDDVVSYRDMVSIIRDRIAALIERGQTLDQVQQSNPTAGYNKEYGSEQGTWTTKMFVQAVYESLIAERGTTR